MRWGEGVGWDMGPYFSWGLNIPVISYTVIQIQRSECTSTNTIILKQGLLISNSTTTKQNCGPSVIDWSDKSDGI